MHSFEILYHRNSEAEFSNGKGALQSSVSHIIQQVTEVLSNHADDLITFNLDQEILEKVSTGFYGACEKLTKICFASC